jgi:hypothetical protein
MPRPLFLWDFRNEMGSNQARAANELSGPLLRRREKTVSIERYAQKPSKRLPLLRRAPPQPQNSLQGIS